MTHFTPGPEWLTPERCFIAEWMNAATDPVCSIARARVVPGVTTQLHALRDVAERYVILAGRGVARVGAERIDVAPGAVLHIPAGVPQQIANPGPDDLVFLCVCTPRFTPESYIDLEAQPRQSGEETTPT